MKNANQPASGSTGETASQPKGETKPLEGKIETDDNFGYLSELIAYQALRDSLRAVAADIQKKLPTNPSVTAADVVTATAAAATAATAVSAEAEAIGADRSIFRTGGDKDAADRLVNAAQDAAEAARLAQTTAEQAAAAAAAANTHIPILTPDPNTPPTKILILNSLNVVQSYVPLVQIDTQLKEIGTAITDQMGNNERVKSEVERVINEIKTPDTSTDALPVAAVITGFTSVVSLMADLIGYFKTDVSIKGQKFSLKSDALAPVVASYLREKSEYDVFVGNFRWIKESDLVSRFSDLLEKRTKLFASKRHIEILRKELEEKTKGKDLNPKQTNALQISKDAMIASDSLIGAFDSLAKAITQIGENQDGSLLATAVIAEQVQKMGITHFLYLTVISSGGEATTKRELFQLSSDAAFIGGVVFSYILARVSGEVIASDTVAVLADMEYRFSSDTSEPPKPRTISGLRAPV